MSSVAAILALVASGRALLSLARLATGARAADLALSWLVGSAAFAAAAPLLRFGLGIPLSRPAVAALVLLAPAAWAALALRRPRGASPGVASSPARAEARTRWIPRPLWVFLPVAAYVAVVTAAVVLHGVNTPTHSHDGLRVRAFAPMLAFADEWDAAARALFVTAGALPTFAPALGSVAAGTLDPFGANCFVLAELVALLVLAVALGASRGSPERGWASALALLSIPLLVYHCTSTLSDAVLAMRLGGALLFAIEYTREHDPLDAARGLLLFGLATLVKREGELVVAAPAAVLVAQLAWDRLRGRTAPVRVLLALAVPVAAEVLGKVAAVGLAQAFPMAGFVAGQAAAAAGADGAGGPSGVAAAVFVDAMFRSGNAGMLYWALLAALALRARALARTGMLWPLAGVAALLGETAVVAIWLVPQFTTGQSLVHRALLAVSVPAALWVAAAVTDGASAERAVRTDAAPVREAA